MNKFEQGHVVQLGDSLSEQVWRGTCSRGGGLQVNKKLSFNRHMW